jgi:hypothetical protein
MQNDQQNEIYINADKFINLANELVQSGQSGVGAALRFAAARYSAFEASLRTQTLAADKESEHQLFADEFARMLNINLEDYIKVQDKT